jgi:putative transposase
LQYNLKNIYRDFHKRKDTDEKIKEEITNVHKDHPAYGSFRVALELQLNHKRIARVMKKYGIKPPRRKKKSHFITVSVKTTTYTNLIRNLVITHENQVWVTDTSELKFHGNKWYIVTIIVVFTRQVRGVTIGRHHDSQLVFTAIHMAIKITNTTSEIFHSDQGTEFMAKLCTEFLEGFATKISVSDKASPWQNGYQESFFGRFKEEFGDINRFETVGEMLEGIYQYIHYYNTRRIHTALKMPPVVFAKKYKNIAGKLIENLKAS